MAPERCSFSHCAESWSEKQAICPARIATLRDLHKMPLSLDDLWLTGKATKDLNSIYIFSAELFDRLLLDDRTLTLSGLVNANN